MSKASYPQKPIIVVVGPTASGKSDLAVKLAKKYNGEVISADSRQVYRGMDIGTGKITKKEMANIPHYLLNVASPSRRFTVAQYVKLARQAIKKIQNSHGRVRISRGSKPSERFSHANKLPIICGGTGFYIRALIDDLQIPAVKPNLKLRARLEKKTTTELFNQLQKLDPRRAANIDSKNPRRLVRALEIVLTTGRPVPELNPPQPSLKGGGKKGSPPLGGVRGDFKPLFLGIKKSQPELAQRIKIRLEKRLRQGMLQEVKNLRKSGLSWKRLDDFGLEYRWLAKYLQKQISYDEMVSRLQKDIEHYAKRQMTWFNKDKRIHWIKDYPAAIKFCQKFIKS